MTKGFAVAEPFLLHAKTLTFPSVSIDGGQENPVVARSKYKKDAGRRAGAGERGFALRKILIGMALGCCLFASTAQAATTLEILPTHRQDRLAWNKADLGGVPNILSELKWENLRIYAIKGVLRHDTGRKTFLEATGSFGWIYSGTNQDSDYDQNDRQDEYSRSYANAGDGRGTVVSLGLDHSLGKNWSLGAAIDYTSYTANKGTDQVNFADGSNLHIPLNKVTWDSWAYRLTATYRF